MKMIWDIIATPFTIIASVLLTPGTFTKIRPMLQKVYHFFNSKLLDDIPAQAQQTITDEEKNRRRDYKMSICCVITLLYFGILSYITVPVFRDTICGIKWILLGQYQALNNNYDAAIWCYDKGLDPFEKRFAKIYLARGMAKVDAARKSKNENEVRMGLDDIDKSLKMNDDLIYNEEVCHIYSFMANDILERGLDVLRLTNQSRRSNYQADYEKICSAKDMLNKANNYFEYLRINDKWYGRFYDYFEMKRKKCYKKLGDIYFYRMRNFEGALYNYKEAKKIQPTRNDLADLQHDILIRISTLYLHEADFLLTEHVKCSSNDSKNNYLCDAIDYYDKSINEIKPLHLILENETSFEGNKSKRNGINKYKIFEKEYYNSIYSNLTYANLKLGVCKFCRAKLANNVENTKGEIASHFNNVNAHKDKMEGSDLLIEPLHSSYCNKLCISVSQGVDDAQPGKVVSRK